MIDRPSARARTSKSTGHLHETKVPSHWRVLYSMSIRGGFSVLLSDHGERSRERNDGEQKGETKPIAWRASRYVRYRSRDCARVARRGRGNVVWNAGISVRTEPVCAQARNARQVAKERRDDPKSDLHDFIQSREISPRGQPTDLWQDKSRAPASSTSHWYGLSPRGGVGRRACRAKPKAQ